MKSTMSRALISIFIVVFLASCTRRVMYLSPTEVARLSAQSRIEVETTDGATVELRNAKIENRTLIGTTEKQGPVRLDFSSIKSARIERIDKTGLGLAIVLTGAAVVLAWLAIEAENAPSPPPAKCCPFIYAYDGESYHLDAEPFGASFCEGLKRAEWTVMEHLAETDGGYRVLLANELRETQYTDELSLLVVDHPAGLRVVPDASGGLHTISALQPPRSARNSYGEDLLPLISRRDGLPWQTDLERVDPEVRESLRDELTFDFQKPAGARTAKLLVNASTSLWGAQMGERFLSLYGDSLPDWYSEVDRHGPAWFKTMVWQSREEMNLLQIRVLTKNGWKTKGLIYGGEPFVSTDKAYALDIGDVPGETLTVRVTPPANFWSIDHLAVDYTLDSPVSVIEVEPNPGVRPKGPDDTAALKETDGSYLVMAEGCDPMGLSFAAPPAVPGTARTVILKASGYYDIHVQCAGLQPQRDLLRRFGSEHGSAIQFSMKEYLAWQAGQAANPRAAQKIVN